MARYFRYKARDKIGDIVEGLVMARTMSEAGMALAHKGLYPTKIRPDATKPAAPSRAVPTEELIVFTIRLAALLKAGVPVISALKAIADQPGGGRQAGVPGFIIDALEEGGTLGEAMRARSDFFPEVYTAMISAGEESGALVASLDSARKLLEKEFELGWRIKEITRYPKIVLAGMALALVIILGFVAPRYATVFARAGVELPFITVALMSAGRWFGRYWPFMALLISAGAILFRAGAISVKGRLALDTLKLQLPLTGHIALNLALAQWTNALGRLLHAGIPVLRALELSANIAGNMAIRRVVVRVGEAVSEGAQLNEQLGGEALIPPFITQLICAGETSGALDEMLFKTSELLEDEAWREIRKLTTFAESAMVVALGLLVMLVAFSIFLPMWDITRMAHH